MLVSLLLWEGESLGAAFGFCGWLPYRKQMEDLASSTINGDALDQEEDPFLQSGADSTTHAEVVGTGLIFAGEDPVEPPPTEQAMDYLREELEIPKRLDTLHIRNIPIFLGHGTEDEKVPLSRGREAVSCLRSLGADISLREYGGLGHWYSGQMLQDVVAFLKGTFEQELG